MRTPGLASQTTYKLGPHVRLSWKKPIELPAHPIFLSSDASDGVQRPDASTYAATILAEAEGFMTSYLPSNFKTKSRDKSSPPSTAPVELLSHEIASSGLPSRTPDAYGAPSEAWFARTSIHENVAKDGTATWEEFDFGLRVDHSAHEMEYTPDVKEAHLCIDWNEELQKVDRKVGDWEDVQMEVREMLHQLPPPLEKRVFPVLIVTARRREELLVVQMPVGTKGLPLEAEGGVGVKYHNIPKVTGGQYVSIERAQVVDDGKKVKWQMATASDANGNLPMWAQKMGVPGAVVKDVGLFIDWTAKRRKGT
nr:hypothetical protein B0A51_10037 [Rachicladosporium sp. CCFEE 5018]